MLIEGKEICNHSFVLLCRHHHLGDQCERLCPAGYHLLRFIPHLVDCCDFFINHDN
jgi:hypothetical protein